MARDRITIGSTTEELNDARLPASLGSASQVLKMNGSADAIVWSNQDPGVIVSPTEPVGAEIGAVWIDTSVPGVSPQDISSAVNAHNQSNTAHNDIRSSISSKYTFPESGIPKTDLSDGVQASLDLADTAIQSHQSLSDYRTSADQDVIDSGKASASHNHDDRYYTETEVDTALSEKAAVSHNHDDRYYTETEVDTALSEKAAVSHTHDDRYYTETEVDTALSEKAAISHIHDDRYYTESEIDTALSGKAEVSHNHDDRYYTETETNTLIEDKADRADVLPLINIWNEQWELGTINTSTGADITYGDSIRTVGFIKVNPSTKYYVKISDGHTFTLYYYNANKGYISPLGLNNGSQEITTPSSCYYMRFVVGTTQSYANNVSINYPSTYHGYYPSRLAKVESRVTNRNLLDNPWLWQINQRGNTSYSGAVYCVDRWQGVGSGFACTNHLNSRYFECSCSNGVIVMQQVFDTDAMKQILGKVCTFSAMLYDGTIISGNATIVLGSDMNNEVAFSTNMSIGFFYNGTTFAFRLYATQGTTVLVRAFKLELGTVSTLHMDVAPNYAEELLKCQRYAIELTEPSAAYSQVGDVYKEGNSIVMHCYLPTSMRYSSNKTVSITSGLIVTNNRTSSNGDLLSVTLNAYSQGTNMMTFLITTNVAFSDGDTGHIQKQGHGRFFISADL